MDGVPEAIVFAVPVIDDPAKIDVGVDVPVEGVSGELDVPLAIAGELDVPLAIAGELDVPLAIAVGVGVPLAIAVPAEDGVVDVPPADVWMLVATPAGRIFRPAEP